MYTFPITKSNTISNLHKWFFLFFFFIFSQLHPFVYRLCSRPFMIKEKKAKKLFSIIHCMPTFGSIISLITHFYYVRTCTVHILCHGGAYGGTKVGEILKKISQFNMSAPHTSDWIILCLDRQISQNFIFHSHFEFSFNLRKWKFYSDRTPPGLTFRLNVGNVGQLKEWYLCAQFVYLPHLADEIVEERNVISSGNRIINKWCNVSHMYPCNKKGWNRARFSIQSNKNFFG